MINLGRRIIGKYNNRMTILLAFGILLVILNFYMFQDERRNFEDQSIIERHLQHLQPLTEAVTQYYREKRTFPSTIEELNLDFAYSPKIFESIDLHNQSGEIIIRFTTGRLIERELFLRPVLAADGSIYRWLCHSEKGRRIKQRQLPFQCSPSHPVNRLVKEWDLQENETPISLPSNALLPLEE